jgi:tetratricopeptide (TPR) repeat protein
MIESSLLYFLGLTLTTEQDRKIAWHSDYAEGLRLAKSENKPILLYVVLLDLDHLKESQIDPDLPRRVIAVKIPYEKGGEDVLRELGSSNTTCLVDPTGELVAVLDSLTTESFNSEALSALEHYPKLCDLKEKNRSSPQDLAIMRAIADLFDKLNNPAKASMWFQKIAAAIGEPRDDTTRRLLAGAYQGLLRNRFRIVEIGDEQAENSLTRLIAEMKRLDPDNSLDVHDDAIEVEVTLQIERGDYMRAIRTAREALERFPGAEKAPSLIFRIGVANLRNNDPQRASEAFKALIRDYPNAPTAERARNLLKEMDRRE